MTKKRLLYCPNPECPHESLKKMSDWIRSNLPDSSMGFMVSDLDFILYNYKTKMCIFIEIKTHNAELRFWQSSMLKNLERWMEKGIDDGWLFGGVEVIKFENSSFQDGKVWLNEKETTEEELKKVLSI